MKLLITQTSSQPPFTFSLLGRNILLSTLFSYTLNLSSSETSVFITRVEYFQSCPHTVFQDRYRKPLVLSNLVDMDNEAIPCLNTWLSYWVPWESTKLLEAIYTQRRAFCKNFLQKRT